MDTLSDTRTPHLIDPVRHTGIQLKRPSTSTRIIGGTGTGRALYTELFDRLANMGYCNVYAGISLPNPASEGFHEVMGFSRVGVFRSIGYKFGGWHDVSWWQRQLRDQPPKHDGVAVQRG